MSVSTPTTIRGRAARSLTPAVLVRSSLLAILAIVAAPLLALVGVLLFGVTIGANLATAPTGALLQAAGVNVILYGSAGLAILIGVLTIAQFHAGSYTPNQRPLRRALSDTFATLPRLLGALSLLIAAVLVALLGWAPITVAALVLAVVLYVRHRRSAPTPIEERARLSPGTRRALVWAIPFLPLLVALATVVALFPSSLHRARSVRALLRSALDRARFHKRSLLLLVLVVAPVSAGLTWIGTTMAAGVQADATEAASGGFIGGTLLLALTLAILLAFAGTAIAVLSPLGPPSGENAAASAARPRVPYTDLFRRATPVMRRTAIVTVVALSSTFVATPAFAAEPAASTPTEMSVSELDPSRVGGDMTFSILMTSNGTLRGVTGSVEVYSGATLVTTVDAGATNNTENPGLLYGVVVPTETFSSRTIALRFVYVPTGEFLPSEDTISVNLAKAFTTIYITATPSWNETITWGDSHSIVANVTGEIDGPRTLIVRDGARFDSPIAASVDFTITDGKATVSLDLTQKLGYGARTYRAEVLGTDTSAAAGTDEYTININQAPTTVAVTVSFATVGRPVTLLAVASSSAANAAVGAGQMTFYVNGEDLGAVAVDSTGRASTKYTPTTAADFVVRADFSQVAAPYTHQWSSSGNVTAEVTRANAPWPTSHWSGDLSLEDTYLDISYAAAVGLPAPTGWVQIVDSRYVPVGRGYLVDGTVRLKIAAISGEKTYYAKYEGDDLYLDRQTSLPDLIGASYVPVLEVTLPVEPRIGTTLSVGVALSDVPVDLVEEVTVRDYFDGRTFIGTIALNGAGTGSLDWSTLRAGDHPLVVEVTYTNASGLAPTVSKRLITTVLPAEIPDLRVTTDTDASALRAGAPVNLVVTAHTLASGTPGLATGTEAVIVDAAGRGLGTVTLVTGPDGLVGSITVSTLRGGVTQVHAQAAYGPLNRMVNGPVFDLTLAAPTTYLSVSAAPVTAGYQATLSVAANVPFGLPGESTNLAATVTVDDVDYPVTLRRSNGTDAFTSTVEVPTTSAGWLAATAATTGDGIDTGPATFSTTFYVDKRSTSLYLLPIGNAVVSESLTVTVNMSRVESIVQNAGTVRVTLTPSGATCVAAPNEPCTFPAWAVREGTNVAVARYSGDDQYLPAKSSSVSFEAVGRYSILATSYDPLPEQWIEGEPVTVSWAVTTSGAPASGLVEARIGANRCSGPALAGRCVIIVPDRAWGATDPRQAYSTVFVPFDDAPAQRSDGNVFTRGCVTAVAFDASLDLSEATACQRGTMQGVLTGSIVTITKDAPAPNFVHTRWSFQGATPRYISQTDLTLSVSVRAAMRVWSLSRYGPQCFTLTLKPNTTTAFDPGRLISFTEPNCASPDGASATELSDKEAGLPRYAAGTVVELYAAYNTENRGETSWDRPALDLLSFDGAEREVANPAFAHVVMDRDRTVTAKFKVRDCIPISIVSAKGGTVVVQSSKRPSSTARFTPYSGACADASGAAGYVPGTRLTLKAVADTGMGVAAFSEADNHCSWEESGACAEFDPTFAVRAVGSISQNAASQLQDVTVRTKARYGAIFSEVRCVAVTTTTSSPMGMSYSRFSESEVVDSTSLILTSQSGKGQQNCGGNRSTSSQSTLGAYSQSKRVDWLVASGVLRVTTKHDAITYGNGRNGAATTVWSTSTDSGVLQAGTAGSTSGPRLDLAAVGSTLTIAANWYASSCRVPVQLPQGGAVSVASDSAEPSCPAGQWTNDQSGIITADPALNAPNLVPFFSVATYNGQGYDLRPAPDGRSYSRGYLNVPDMNLMRQFSPRLEYCAPLDLNVRVLDDVGKEGAMPASDVYANIADNGGCPPDWARPGRTVGIGLTNAGNYAYSLVDGTASTGASVSLDTQGVITDTVDLPLKLRSICFSVKAADSVSFTTPGNCPGGASNRFLRGSVVQIELELEQGSQFRGWKDVAQSKGTTAWVIVSEDRAPWAVIHRPGDLEILGNVASNLAQRALSAVVTFATGVLLGEMYVVQALALGMQGVSTALHAMGVEGRVLDGFDEGIGIITSQVAMVSMLSSCVQSWSSGDGITELPIDDEFLAAGADMAAGEITDRISERLETALKNSGRSGAASMMGAIGNGRDMANIFGSNLDMLGRGATVGWNSLADDVGGCMVNGMEKAGWK